MSETSLQMRWDPYVLASGKHFDSFWRGHLAPRERRVLLVLGRGFDARALAVSKRLVEAGARPDVWLLSFENGLEDSERRMELTSFNEASLIALVGADAIKQLLVTIGGAAGGNATSRNTRQVLKGAGTATGYDDVVVDISAMPRMVAMTAVAKLLFDLDAHFASGGRDVNLHVTTAESVSADIGNAKGSLNDEVTTVSGFSGHLTAQGTEHVPRVWFPVLGEGQRERLLAIQERINPDEICPVIPFPTREPRRGDEIIEEHREILFDEMNVEPKNILLACEYNPFEAYKQIFLAMNRYSRALGELGGCKAFVSPLSSKLLSIGALLACYDHQTQRSPGLFVGIPYVETAAYSDPDEVGDDQTELFSMWIRGEWER